MSIKDETPDMDGAKKRALFLLGNRDYSGAELYKKLMPKYPAETCGEAVEWLKELGYIDDRKYAEKLMRRLKEKCWGKRKIRYELKLKGIDEELIDELIEGISDDSLSDEIMRLIEKKYMDKLGERDGRQKVIGAIMRRGFDYDDVKYCVLRAAESRLEGEERL